MVNVVIYLKKEYNPQELVKHLLSQKLIASASIDTGNVFYEMEDDLIIENAFNVITAHSKALLFRDIVLFVNQKIGEEVPINSIPIVASNKSFETKILTKTIPK